MARGVCMQRSTKGVHRSTEPSAVFWKDIEISVATSPKRRGIFRRIGRRIIILNNRMMLLFFYLSERVCGDPGEVQNAEISHGNTSVGSQRTYTCIYDIHKSFNVLCQHNETWSVAQIHCPGLNILLIT